MEEVKALLKELLKNDSEIREIIKKIVKSEEKLDNNTEEKNENLEGELKERSEVIEELKNKRSELEEKLQTILAMNESLERQLRERNEVIEELKNKRSELEEKLKSTLTINENLEGQLREQNETIKELKEKYNVMRDRSAKEIEKLTIEKNELEKKYTPQEKLLLNYSKLSEQCKNSIQRRLYGKSSQGLLVSAGNQQSMEDLWEYMKNEIMNGKESEDIDLLKEIYDYLFEIYNEISGDKYERMEMMKGELFDTDFHIRISNKKASGEIKEIKLLGYIERESKKIIKKTVVEL